MDGVITNNCFTHFMVVQAGVSDYGVTTNKDIKLKAGSKEWHWTLDAPTDPTAAPEYPESLSMGARMLAAGSASLALSLTLY